MTNSNNTIHFKVLFNLPFTGHHVLILCSLVSLSNRVTEVLKYVSRQYHGASFRTKVFCDLVPYADVVHGTLLRHFTAGIVYFRMAAAGNLIPLLCRLTMCVRVCVSANLVVTGQTGSFHFTGSRRRRGRGNTSVWDLWHYNEG